MIVLNNQECFFFFFFFFINWPNCPWIRFPIWPYAKLFATCWLVLPYFNGAAYVYKQFVKPFYRNPQVQIWYLSRNKSIFSKSDDILTAAEKYIAANGPEEFERLLSRVSLPFDLWWPTCHYDLCAGITRFFGFKCRLIEKQDQGGEVTQSLTIIMDTDLWCSLKMLNLQWYCLLQKLEYPCMRSYLWGYML